MSLARLTDAILVELWPCLVNHHGEVSPTVGMGRVACKFGAIDHMNQDELESSNDPLLDDDETLDFLLYQELEKENGPRSKVGCLGAVGCCLALPTAWLVCRWL